MIMLSLSIRLRNALGLLVETFTCGQPASPRKKGDLLSCTINRQPDCQDVL